MLNALYTYKYQMYMIYKKYFVGNIILKRARVHLIAHS